MLLNSYIYIFLPLIIFYGVNCDRKVTSEINPGCNLPECKDNRVILVHVKAEGESDTLHHLWDFTGKPTFVLALSDKNATLSVSWQEFAFGGEKSVIIDPTPKYIYGTVIDKIIEFNDESNTGELDPKIKNSSYLTLWDTKNYDWKMTNLTNTSGDATLTIEATEYQDSKTPVKINGTIRFVMSAYGGEDHAESLPHLLHSGNASQMDLTLDGLPTKYTKSRFGLLLITTSSDDPLNNTVKITDRQTLDDEHAPGEFTISEMMSPSAQSGGCGGYLQWRPVVYTSGTRDMASRMGSNSKYGVTTITDPQTALNHTLIASLLGPQLNTMLTVTTNITFGVAGDSYYSKTRYAIWTMVLGYGHPPTEQFSMLVTLVLLIGLGLPAIVILFGTVCIVFRRLQRNKDDLFLSR